MTQYDDKVQEQRDKIAAEEWAKQTKSIQVHSLKSMWYDDRPQDTDGGAVTDHEFNSGIIKRYKEGKLIHTFGKELKGIELLNAYIRNN